MLIFLAYRGLLAESALVFLIEEMKEKAQGEKFKDQCAIQVGKDLFTRISYGISKIFLLTLPYSSLLTPRKKKKERKFCGLLSGLFKYPLESHFSEMIRHLWVLEAGPV